MKIKLLSTVIAGALMVGVPMTAFAKVTSVVQSVDSAGKESLIPSNANEVGKNDTLQAPPQLQTLINNGVVSVHETFEHENFTGWLVKNQNNYHLYWATEDNFVIAGPLIDKDGNNITSEYLSKKKPKPDYSKTMAEFEGNALIFGAHKKPKGSPLYVFVEPYCGACSAFNKELQPYIDKGLNVQYVPVSFLSSNSGNVIQAILDNENPGAAYFTHEQNRQQRIQSPMTNPTAETRRNLETNSQFMSEFGIAGTPGLVFIEDGQPVIAGGVRGKNLARLVDRLMNTDS